MNKDINKIGGFDILGDMLTAGPDGISGNPNDPFEVLDEDPIIDPSNSQDPNEEEIVDPSKQTGTPDPEEEIIDPSKDSTPEEEEEIEDPNTGNDPGTPELIDLSEEEPLMLGYLQSKLYEKFGWEYNEEESVKDMDAFAEFWQSVVEESSKPKYASEELEQLDTFVKNGGNIENYLEQRYNGNLDIEKLNLNETANQSLVIREFFKRQGLSSDKIEKRLQNYSDTGILADEAQYAHEILKNQIKKESETLLQEQEKIRKESEAQKQKYINDVISSIEKRKDIRGIPLTPAKQKKLIDYMFKADQKGVTGFQKDYSGSIEPFIEAAFFTMEKDTLVGQLNKQASSVAARQLKEKLAAKTKRNKNASVGGFSNNSDSDVLASLGAMITGS